LLIKLQIFRDKATSALAGFHADPVSWSNWNLELLVCVPENPEENPWYTARTSNKLNPHMASGHNQTRAMLVEGQCSCHYTISAPVYG